MDDTIPKHLQLHIAQLAKIITPEPTNDLPTKPAPPPRPVQHVANVVHNVVCPPQDSCSKCVAATSISLNVSTANVIHCVSLPIVFPSIPETGTKSRVETQVRITVDLAHASSSQGPFLKYDRVGSWKCLKLPPDTSTKRRTRKEGKIGTIDHPIIDSSLFILLSGFYPRCCTPRYFAINGGSHVLIAPAHAGCSLL
jgi:hypothetical protein